METTGKDEIAKKMVGNCDDISNLIIERMKKFDWCVDARLVHGELAHSANFPSKYWWLEHTLVEADIVENDDYPERTTQIYIDGTCGQFRTYPIGILVMRTDGSFYRQEFPTYYLSERKPEEMFLFDRDGWVFGDKTRKLNEWVKRTFPGKWFYRFIDFKRLFTRMHGFFSDILYSWDERKINKSPQ